MIHDVSVIIPVKDEQELPFLVSLLDDICRQSDIKYRLEIVIIAQDGVRKIIEQTYRLKDRFEYVPPIQVREVGNTPIRARNWGARCASGDILVFFDCDNKIGNLAISDLAYPIISVEYMMTYSPQKYDDMTEAESSKDHKLIKHNNFLLRFDLLPRIPFAIHKRVFHQLGALQGKNPMFTLCSKLLWKYPGGIKKVDADVLVSPRHILERAKKKSK